MIKSKRPLIFAILGLTLVLFISQFLQPELVFDRRNIAAGQWWRIFSGNLTHSNYPHLLLNLSGLWILGFLFIDSLKTKTFITSIFILGLIVGSGLYYFIPVVENYYGFSGVLYGLCLIGGVSAIMQKDYFTGVSVTLLITAKIIWDYFNGGSSSSEQLIGIPVATDAHLYGFIGAILVSSILYISHLKNN